MELTKKRKIMIGLLAVGLTALVVDRLMLAPPKQAQAAGPLVTAVPDAATSSADTTAETATQSPATPGGELPQYAALTDRMRSLAAQVEPDVADVNFFAEPDGWAPPEPTEAQAQEPTGPIEDPVAFLAACPLSGIVETNKGTAAKIGDRELFVGDTLEGFILRGFIQNTRVGHAAHWESIKSGQIVIMPMYSPNRPIVTDGPR